MHFEQFYRANLRFVPGARLRSSDVGRFYSAWARATAAPGMTARELKDAMHHIGHRALRTNGIAFCDVALAAECRDVADNFPMLPLPHEAHAAAIADRLDTMITELASIRAEVAGAPHSH
jgi:hypothetical protein